MATRIAMLVLLVPLATFALLLAVPALDDAWGTSLFHFRVVSAASLLAASACFVLIASARSIRETRTMFLALSFFSLGMIFSVHGLTTPGHIFDHPTAAIARSPWLATLAAATFAALSVSNIPGLFERSRLRLPEATFVICAGAVLIYFGVSLAFTGWLQGFPSEDEWFQHILTVATIGLLGYASWRYFESYMLTRLASQLAVVMGLMFIAEAQLSLDFGRFWMYSWWMYHGLFLVAFVTVLCGWGWELLRARDIRSISEAIAMRDALAQVSAGRSSTLISLADQIENHDAETHRHVDRVAGYAYAIGKELGFGAVRLRDLVLAAQMHDIGKVGLPAYILQKPQPLTDDEWRLIQQHPAKGYDIVARLKGLSEVSQFVRHHHERWDGRGYPDALAGEHIPLESRIISVADTYDALTCDRPYRRALTPEAAREELRRVAGVQLDPHCVAAFLLTLEGEAKPVRPTELDRVVTQDPQSVAAE
jgi:HD-GYP domain-containing protein (c-di-GMP phosphodiesterase class II)